MRNMFGLYYLTDLTLGEVGNMFGLSKQAVKGSLNRFVRDLWENSSEEIKTRFSDFGPKRVFDDIEKIRKITQQVRHREFRRDNQE